MTTDTKPSEAALEIARKIAYAQKEFDHGAFTLPVAETAELIDAGVREMREALKNIAFTCAGRASANKAVLHQVIRSVRNQSQTALRAWRQK